MFQYSIRWQDMDPENAGSDGEYRDIELEDYLSFREARNGQGTEASRPTGLGGDWFYATDTSRLFWNDGTGWIIMSEPEQSYTPTWANVTLGTGPTRTGRYRRSNGLIYVGATLILGTGGALTGAPSVSMPSGITLGAIERGALRFYMLETGVAAFTGENNSISVGATTVTPLVFTASGTYVGHANLSATVPHTWGDTDRLVLVDAWVPMETRYL